MRSRALRAAAIGAAGLAGVTLIPGSLAGAASSERASLGAPLLATKGKTGAQPMSLTTSFTFSTTAAGGTTVHVAKEGNIIDFISPNGYDHIFSEGYVLCYDGGAGLVNAFEIGSSSAGFAAATSIAIPATSIRKTLDGKMQLTQTYTFDGQGRTLDITMTLKNTSAATITNATFRRLADFDVDAYGSLHWATPATNNHASPGLYIAWNDASDAAGKQNHAIGLQNLQGFPIVAQLVDNGRATQCDPPASSAHLDHNDAGGTLKYTGITLAAGQSKVIRVRYTRY